MIAFGLWGLILWWISKRYSGGWSAYWFAFAIASFAPFADSIEPLLEDCLVLENETL